MSPRLKTLKDSADQGGALAFLQLFSGGALTQFAVFALGIMPYITASIIMQILGVVIPKLEEWQNQGAVGQRKITQWTRYVTIGIAVVQSTGLSYLFHKGGGGFRGGNTTGLDLVPQYDIGHVALIVLTLTTGTALLMWMGELVTQRGIGNGMSLLIFASVVSTLPVPAGQDQGRGRRVRAGHHPARVRGHPGRHRVRRTGPAADPRAVRQTGGGQAHVRRPEHLHPAEGQPVGRHPHHLRQLGAVPAPAAVVRAARRRVGGQRRSRS